MGRRWDDRCILATLFQMGWHWQSGNSNQLVADYISHLGDDFYSFVDLRELGGLLGKNPSDYRPTLLTAATTSEDAEFLLSRGTGERRYVRRFWFVRGW